jgi:hypothetical protein
LATSWLAGRREQTITNAVRISKTPQG